MELDRTDTPIVTDRLAKLLAGPKALQIAAMEWEKLEIDQGKGKHMRVPARARIIDDSLLDVLQELSGEGVETVQVVCFGCGMDTRPWRLDFPLSVHWFDVDQEEVIGLKQSLLAESNAQTRQTPTSGVAFPLHAVSYSSLSVDLQTKAVSKALAEDGLDPTIPTIWVTEAVLYYLPLDMALIVLRDMHSVSAPGSHLLCTCIDTELFEAFRKPDSHYFSNLWHFCLDELLQTSAITAAGWTVVEEAQSTKSLALSRYQMETYVPDYGGAECFFVAKAVL